MKVRLQRKAPRQPHEEPAGPGDAAVPGSSGDEAETAPGAAAHPDHGRRPPASRRALRALPWVLVLVAVVAAGIFAMLWQRAGAANRQRAEVAAVASRFLNALTNFQGTTIDADVERIREFAVGGFADQVDTFFDQSAIDALRTAQAKSVGHVQSVFVESLSDGTASVFGVVNETVTNASSQAPRTEVLRLDVQMIETKAGWKVDRVEILRSAGSSPFNGGP
jgi:hypothetical protein